MNMEKFNDIITGKSTSVWKMYLKAFSHSKSYGFRWKFNHLVFTLNLNFTKKKNLSTSTKNTLNTILELKFAD